MGSTVEVFAGTGGYQPQPQQQIPPYILPYHADRHLIIDDFEDYIRLKSLKIERIQLGDRSYRCSKEIRRCAADIFALLEYRMRVANNESLKLSYIEITADLKWYCQRTVEKAARLLTVMGLIWEPRATTCNGQKCMLWRIPREAVQKNILAFAKEQDVLDVTQQKKIPAGLGNQQGKRASNPQRRLNASSGSRLPKNHSPKNEDSGLPQPTYCDLSHSNDSTCEHDVSRVLVESGTPITYPVRDGEPLASANSLSITATIRDAPLNEASNGEAIAHSSCDASRTADAICS